MPSYYFLREIIVFIDFHAVLKPFLMAFEWFFNYQNPIKMTPLKIYIYFYLKL